MEKGSILKCRAPHNDSSGRWYLSYERENNCSSWESDEIDAFRESEPDTSARENRQRLGGTTRNRRGKEVFRGTSQQ